MISLHHQTFTRSYIYPFLLGAALSVKLEIISRYLYWFLLRRVEAGFEVVKSEISVEKSRKEIEEKLDWCVRRLRRSKLSDGKTERENWNEKLKCGSGSCFRLVWKKKFQSKQYSIILDLFIFTLTYYAFTIYVLLEFKNLMIL